MRITPKKILVDIDGVVADFVGAMCKAHGRENPYLNANTSLTYKMDSLWGMSATEFWKPTLNKEFWAEMEKTEEADSLIQSLEEKFGENKICFLTSPTLSPESAAGKMLWIEKNFPAYRRRFLIGPAKEFCAHKKALLIDDHTDNVVKFRQHGGQAFLLPRPWNEGHKLNPRAMIEGLVKSYEKSRMWA